MQIEYYIKNVYGCENMYILNDNIANSVTELTNKKTISCRDIINLEKLGCTFKEVLPPRNK